MTKQRNYFLDRSIQAMLGFFQTRIENLETLATPLAVTMAPKKKKKEKLQEMESFIL